MTERSTLLVLEDNRADRTLLQKFLTPYENQVAVIYTTRADAALALVLGSSPPDVMMVDISLPGVSGVDVLRSVRERSVLVPMVVFSSTEDPTEIRNAYRAGANVVLTKPRNLVDFRSAIRDIVSFWFNLAQLPGDGGRSALLDARSAQDEATG